MHPSKKLIEHMIKVELRFKYLSRRHLFLGLIYIIIIIIIIITGVYKTTECHDTNQCKHL